MIRCTFRRRDFTQTDPWPHGAGSPFEGSHVYAGENPAYMTDPSGRRAGLGLTQLNGNKGAKAPDPTCEACNLTYSRSPSFDSDYGTWGMEPATDADRKELTYWKALAKGGAWSNGAAGGSRDLPLAGMLLSHYLGENAGLIWATPERRSTGIFTE
jgi:hypothetical protein